jgi:hypothetical protein
MNNFIQRMLKGMLFFYLFYILLYTLRFTQEALTLCCPATGITEVFKLLNFGLTEVYRVS